MQRWLKPLVFLLSLSPLAYLLLNADALGPDPGQAVVLETGLWAFNFLLLSLLMTPLRRLTGKPVWLRYRRMLGLFCAFYATLHLLAVLTYMLGWSLSRFAEEFVDRPYMTVGILAWLLLLPLAVTSNQWSMRKLGRRWQRLHRLVYPIAVLVAVHFLWQIRSSWFEPVIYAVLVAALLLFRVIWGQRKMKMGSA